MSIQKIKLAVILDKRVLNAYIKNDKLRLRLNYIFCECYNT